MNNYVRTIMGPRVAQYGVRTAYPVVDIREDEDGYALDAEVPGFTRDDIEVKVEDILLTIQSVEPKPAEGEDAPVTRRPRRSFMRSFVLPRDVDATGITAEVVNGILTLSLPKRAETKARSIEIKGA
ncbi:MAG: Hsp20 family protein [Spirochaetales bacterium]|nr:MAG: Hsp20 family protein [Spirochaetales bacterium]